MLPCQARECNLRFIKSETWHAVVSNLPPAAAHNPNVTRWLSWRPQQEQNPPLPFDPITHLHSSHLLLPELRLINCVYNALISQQNTEWRSTVRRVLPVWKPRRLLSQPAGRWPSASCSSRSSYVLYRGRTAGTSAAWRLWDPARRGRPQSAEAAYRLRGRPENMKLMYKHHLTSLHWPKQGTFQTALPLLLMNWL